MMLKTYKIINNFIEREQKDFDIDNITEADGLAVERASGFAGQEYLGNNNLKDKMKNAAHISWTTGGSLVPEEAMEAYYKKGSDLSTFKK